MESSNSPPEIEGNEGGESADGGGGDDGSADGGGKGAGGGGGGEGGGEGEGGESGGGGGRGEWPQMTITFATAASPVNLPVPRTYSMWKDGVCMLVAVASNHLSPQSPSKKNATLPSSSMRLSLPIVRPYMCSCSVTDLMSSPEAVHAEPSYDRV